MHQRDNHAEPLPSEPPSRQDLLLLQGLVAADGIRGAARAAGLTQAASVRRLSRLERRMGVRLVDAERGTARLTKSGWAVLAAGSRLLQSLDSVLRLVTEETSPNGSGRLPTLRLATFGKDWSELADRLAEQVPGMLLSATTAEPAEAVELFERHQVDAAYVWQTEDWPLPCDRPIACHDVLAEPLWVALPEHHRYAWETAVDLSTLAQERWIVGATEGAVALLRRATNGRFEPQIGYVARSGAEVRGLLVLGHGVALSSPLVVRPMCTPGFVVRPLRDAPRRQHTLVFDPTFVAEQLVEVIGACLVRLYAERAERRNPEYRRSRDFPVEVRQHPTVVRPPQDAVDRLAAAVPTVPAPRADASLEPEDVHLLRVVKECGSINRAAPVLLITQPALTRRIGRLESRLGIRLLDRTHRGTALTTAARRLLDGVGDAESAFRSVVYGIRNDNQVGLGVAA